MKGGGSYTARLVIAYDGTRYAGWQRQRNAPTVQAALESALQRLTGRRIAVVGAGRTDAGVHAWGQVAHVRITTRLRPAVVRRALNALLPHDLLIRQVTLVSDRFHAQHQATRKWYRYRIATGPTKPLFTRAWVHWVPQPLNVAAMRRAARCWVGRHNFRAFHSSGSPAASTWRTITTFRVTRRAPFDHGRTGRGVELHVDIQGDGFLYHMVRRLVGVLLEIGKGKPQPVVAPTAPAQGLCLMRVTYA